MSATEQQRDWISESAPTGGLLFSTPTLTPGYLAANRLSADFPKRFWSKVCETDCCWIWQGSKIDDSYGQCARGKPFAGMVSAHVASWILHRGPVPKGLCVLHNCPNGDCPGCVNPSHLWTGTRAANMRDKASKGRSTKGWPGESHKLSAELAMQIRDLARHRIFPQKQIASEYAVSKETVKQIVRGETWRTTA